MKSASGRRSFLIETVLLVDVLIQQVLLLFLAELALWLFCEEIEYLIAVSVWDFVAKCLNHGLKLRLGYKSYIAFVLLLIDGSEDVLLFISCLSHRPARVDLIAKDFVIVLLNSEFQFSLEDFIVVVDDFEFLGLQGGSLLLHLNFIGHSLLSLTARSLLSKPGLATSEAEG